MREKYIDERWQPLFTVPTSSPNVVILCTEDQRVDLAVGPKAAEELEKNWNAMQAALVRCALAFNAASPEAFDAFWYGSELEK